MKFTLAAVLALAATAIAAPQPMRKGRTAVTKRQATQDNVDVAAAAMSTREGGVAPFDTAGVYQPMKEAGL